MWAINLHLVHIFIFFEKESLIGEIDGQNDSVSFCELEALSKLIFTIPVLLVCSSWFCSVASWDSCIDPQLLVMAWSIPYVPLLKPKQFVKLFCLTIFRIATPMQMDGIPSPFFMIRKLTVLLIGSSGLSPKAIVLLPKFIWFNTIVFLLTDEGWIIESGHFVVFVDFVELNWLFILFGFEIKWFDLLF